MGLRLRLRPGERLVINGCVLRNGRRPMDIEVETRADVLRGDELLDAATATTPTRSLGYCIQIALVSVKDRAEYLPRIDEMAAKLGDVYVGERRELLKEVLGLVHKADFYRAWRALLPLVRYEDCLLAGSDAQLEERV